MSDSTKRIDGEKLLETEYTKAQLLKSKKFSQHRDILSAVLMDGENYTITQAESLVKNFLRRKV